MLRNTIVCVVALVSIPLPASAQWVVFEETMVMGTVTGVVQSGTVFRTASGNIYEVSDPIIEVVVLVMPRALVLQNGPLFRMILEGIDRPFLVRRLNDGSPAGDPDGSPQVIESRIDGDFEGYEYENIYRLRNGQLWEQTGGRYRYRYRYAPEVIIVRRSSGFEMKVEGMEDWVAVRRLR